MGETTVAGDGSRSDAVEVRAVGSEAQAAKDYWSTHHCQSARVIAEGADDLGHDHRYALARHIAAIPSALSIEGSGDPLNVWEFGCSSGRNLALLRALLPHAYLGGIDINRDALRSARDAHPSIEFIEDDEHGLRRFGDRTIDVIFTCSVLDHIPTPEWRSVYDEMKRIACTVVLLEPIRANLHPTIDVPADFLDIDLGKVGIAAPPFSYAHDYPDYDPDLRVVRRVIIPSLSYPVFGSLYTLMEFRHRRE